MEFSVEKLNPGVAGDNNQVAAGGRLLDLVKDLLAQLGDSLPPKDEFLKIVADAYDNYVAPIDIPQIPNVIEAWVDQMLKAVILKQAERIYDNLVARG